MRIKIISFIKYLFLNFFNKKTFDTFLKCIEISRTIKHLGNDDKQTEKKKANVEYMVRELSNQIKAVTEDQRQKVIEKINSNENALSGVTASYVKDIGVTLTYEGIWGKWNHNNGSITFGIGG